MVHLELLFLLVAVVVSDSTRSTGQDFLIVFPENIAYYYIKDPVLFMYVTALHDDTEVTVTHPYLESDQERTLQSGETERFDLDKRLELRKTIVSDNVVHVSSTKDIVVQAIGGKAGSAQSVLVLPTERLGRRYVVPLLSIFNGTKHPLDNTITTERNPYHIIVVNTDEENNVTLEGTGQFSVLAPHQSLQVPLDPEKELRAVIAEKPVAVLFINTCAIKLECTCGLLYTVLPPETTDQQIFLVPPNLASGAEKDSLLIVTDGESTNIEAYKPDSSVIDVTGGAIFYRPGMLLPLIPESEFASCYVIYAYSAQNNFAVIVVRNNQTDGIRLQNDILESPDWQPINGTEYVSAKISLQDTKTVLWHVSSSMGVYHLADTQDTSPFGNQAPDLSRTPDYRGCAVTPEVLEIGSEPDGWRESVAHCREKEMELVSLTDAEFKQHLQQRITKEKEDGMEQLWIGMRLSLSSSIWYWLNKKPLTEMDWMDGEPNTEEGHCVIMNVEKDFGWKTGHCCMEANPVCYKDPVLLSI